jgi:hypothetical protein
MRPSFVSLDAEKGERIYRVEHYLTFAPVKRQWPADFAAAEAAREDRLLLQRIAKKMGKLLDAPLLADDIYVYSI